MESVSKTVMMKPEDHVAVALANIPAGTRVQVTCRDVSIEVTLREAIDFGHKFAVVPISSGQDIRKYGEIIGVAIRDIEPGQHVHVHNVEGKRGRGDLLEQSGTA